MRLFWDRIPRGVEVWVGIGFESELLAVLLLFWVRIWVHLCAAVVHIYTQLLHVQHIHISSAYSRVLILLKTELLSVWSPNWLLRRVTKSCCCLHLCYIYWSVLERQQKSIPILDSSTLCIYIGSVLLLREREYLFFYQNTPVLSEKVCVVCDSCEVFLFI